MNGLNKRHKQSSKLSTNIDNNIQYKKYECNDKSDENIDDSRAVYPETVSAYIEGLTDGIKYDLKDLFESSVKVLDKSFKFLFGDNKSDNHENNNDFTNDIEIKSNNKINHIVTNNESAIRMRCPSTWSTKPLINQPAISLTNQSNDKFGKKISLSKLYNSKILEHFECNDDCVVIIGQRRMLYVQKNNDIEATANILWFEMFPNIENCIISFQTNGIVKLELETFNHQKYSIFMSDTMNCVKILQIIQERKQSNLMESNDSNNKQSTTYNTNSNKCASIANSYVNINNIDVNGSNSNICVDKSNSFTNNTTFNNKYHCNNDNTTIKNNNNKNNHCNNLTSNKKLDNQSDNKLSINYDITNSKIDHNIANSATNATSNLSTIQSNNFILLSNTLSTTSNIPVDILSPTSAKKVNNIVKQISFGISDLGIQMKLENDGVSPNKSNILISHAKKMIDNKDQVDSKNNNNNNNNYIQSARLVNQSNSNVVDLVRRDLIIHSTNDDSPFSRPKTTCTSNDLNVDINSSVSINIYNDLQKEMIDSKAHSIIKSSADLLGDIKKLNISVDSLVDFKSTDKLSNSEVTEAIDQPNKYDIKKYQMMIKSGVPLPAVQMKMRQDNVSIEDQKLVINNIIANGTISISECDSKVAISYNEHELPIHLKKYQMMVKTGVPPPAIQMKMKQDNISTEDQQLVMNLTTNSCLTSSNKSESNNENFANELPIHLKKYQMMVKSGVPLPAIQMKMKQDNISTEDKNLIIPNQSSKIEKIEPTTNTSNELPSHLKKYKILLQSGVPEAAVTMKMTQDKIPITDQSLVIPSSTNNQLSLTTGEVPIHLKKYQMMMKTGVPLPAIQMKMKQDNISTEDQQLVIPNQSSTAQVSEIKPAGPKLIGFHWDIIDNENLNPNCIWQTVFSSPPSRTTPSKSINTNSNKKINSNNKKKVSLNDNEYEQLVHIFSRKDNKKLTNNNALNDNNTNNKDKNTTNKPIVLDFSRVMSISIVLTSFKSKAIEIETICNAIDEIKYESTCLDDVLRIKEIVPSDIETKNILQLNKNQLSNLIPSEKIIYLLAKINKLKEKIKLLLFLHTYVDISIDIKSKCQILNNISDSIMTSIGLKEIIRNVLAIGNAMNSSDKNKSIIKGFRLGTLTKLNQTKSSDGKVTILDYLLQMLYSRSQAGNKNSTISLNIDEELLDQLNLVKSIQINELDKSVKLFEIDVNILKDLITNNNEAIDKTNDELIELIQTLTHTRNKINELEQFFGELPNSSNQIFIYLYDFIILFQKSKLKLIKNNKK